MKQPDPRGGIWGDQSRAGLEWTEDEDIKLIRWGLATGHDFIAGHDFNRVPSEGSERIAWLRANKPDFVREHEAEDD